MMSFERWICITGIRMRPSWLWLFLAPFFSIMVPAQSTDLLFNGFKSSNLSLTGMANVDATGVLELTNVSQRLLGHAMYHTPLKFKNASTGSVFSFSTEFVFSITPEYPTLGGHGMAFVVSPSRGLDGSLPMQYLGIFSNSSNGQNSSHIFAVEFDTVKDVEFLDIDDNHVGVDVDSLQSVDAATAAFINGTGGLQLFNLKAERSIRCWIDYDGESRLVNVSVAPNSEPRPAAPLISTKVNLTDVLKDEMYVGFSASTGLLSSAHRVFGWSFSINGRAAELELSKLPQIFAPQSAFKTKGFVIGVTVAAVCLLVLGILTVAHMLRRIKYAEVIEEWELEYGPHRFSYKELELATRGFRETELLGFGGFGRVYRGVLATSGLEIAVKRVSHDSKQGLREFVAEIASIGRLRHRNLVQLQGWCRYRGELLLVYDFMPNGSLDKYLFEDGRITLSWRQRYRILQGVASGLLYLHEEWEQTVVHRDVKASNVLLDSEWNGRLGDFGLARLYEHGSNPHTTHVVGTLGYLAPELTKTGKATMASDVFAFGALLLEVAGGRRPIEHTKSPEELVLVDWIWELHSKGKILLGADPKLQNDYVVEEVRVVLQLGLLCSHPQPETRPTIRQVVQILAGDLKIPALPSEPPSVDTPPMTQCFDDFMLSFSSYRNGSSNTTSHVTASSDMGLPIPAFTPDRTSPVSLLQGRD